MAFAPASIDERTGRELARTALDDGGEIGALVQPRQGEIGERRADVRAGGARHPVPRGRVQPANYPVAIDHHDGPRPLFGHVPEEFGR